MLTFSDGAETYAIEFNRKHTKVETFSGGIRKEITSTYPATTASILKLDPKSHGLKNAFVVATATAGCYVKDKFSLEEGRRAALRKVTRSKKISKDLATLAWDAYLNRSKVQNG